MPTSIPSSLPSSQPSTTVPSSQPSISSTSQLSALQSNPFSQQTWTATTVRKRVRHYCGAYAVYFILLYLILWLAKYFKIFESISNQLHQSANQSKIFEEFKTCEHFENGPSYLVECKNQRDSLVVDAVVPQDVNRIADSDEFIQIHNYIMKKHTYYGCQVVWSKSWFDSGQLEDFMIYLFNHHRYLKCFCSVDTLPFTVRSKRAALILYISIFFIVSTLLEDVLTFQFGINNSHLISLFAWLSKPLCK